MKQLWHWTLLGTVLAAALALLPAALEAKAKASEAGSVQALSGTALTDLEVLGNSTLHKWTVKATQVLVSAALAPGHASLWEGVQAGALKGLTLSAEVAGLKSTEGGAMDKNMYSTLAADKYASIGFVMGSYKLSAGQVDAEGVLSIHGVSRTVDLKGSILGRADCVNIKGSYDLLMSDYGVKAPVMMLGTVRVADKVSISYDFGLAPAP